MSLAPPGVVASEAMASVTSERRIDPRRLCEENTEGIRGEEEKIDRAEAESRVRGEEEEEARRAAVAVMRVEDVEMLRC